MMLPLYQALAIRADAYHRCVKNGNDEWRGKHANHIFELCDRHLPSGSGLDLGPRLDIEQSTGEKLVIERADFHHMNEAGSYDGWTEHVVTVRPSLMSGFDLAISGRNRNDIKDYLHEVFHCALSTQVED